MFDDPILPLRIDETCNKIQGDIGLQSDAQTDWNKRVLGKSLAQYLSAGTKRIDYLPYNRPLSRQTEKAGLWRNYNF